MGKIYIYGEIKETVNPNADAYGYSSLITVKKQVENQPDSEFFDVHINSVGGEVDEGFKIYDYLKSLGKPINTYSEGMIASMGTVIFMAGENRYIRPTDKFMIHFPSIIISGKSKDLEASVVILKELENKFLEFYSQFTNIEETDMKGFLNEDTFLTSEQLISFGFATEIISDLKAVAKLNININKQEEKQMSEQMSKEQVEGLFNGFFAKLGDFIKGKPKAKLVQDAEGVEIDFTDLGEDDTPAIGDKATVGGEDAQGEYLLPSGETYVFEAGALVEIKAVVKEEKPQPSEEVEALKAKIAELEAQASAKAKLVTELEKEVKTIKASISGKYIYDEPADVVEQTKSRTFKTKF